MDLIEDGVSRGIVDFRDFSAFDWDTVIFFSPYVTAERISTTAGVSWSAFSDPAAFSYDSYALVVFIQANEIVAHFDVRRDRIDFASLDGRGFSPATARFEVMSTRAVNVLRRN